MEWIQTVYYKKNVEFLKLNQLRSLAVQHRDLIGPRKPIKLILKKKADAISGSCEIDFDYLMELQRKQTIKWERYGRQNENIKKVSSREKSIIVFFQIGCLNLKKIRKYNIKLPKNFKVTATDIRFVMSLGFQNATVWANHFEPFWSLSNDEKTSVLSEYGIAFILMEQAIKTVNEGIKGVWLLQTGTSLLSPVPCETEQEKFFIFCSIRILIVITFKNSPKICE